MAKHVRNRPAYVTLLESSQLNWVEGFHFLFMQDLTTTNPDDWSDEDLWNTVLAYMILVMPTDSTSPSDEGRFTRAIAITSTGIVISFRGTDM